MLNDLLLDNDPLLRGLGGVVEMQFIPQMAIASMGIPSGLSFTGPLTLKDGQRWFKLEFMDETAYYEENQRITPHGPLYDISIGGFYPKDDLATMELLERMTGFYFLVRAKDFNDRWRIVGNLTEKLEFTKREYSSKALTSRVGYLLEFTGSFRRPGLVDAR
jgi:hypothetical protein